MQILDFCTPVNNDQLDLVDGFSQNMMGSILADRNVDLDGADLALIGVEEDRNSVKNTGCASAPDHVRRQLYNLNQGNYKCSLIDLGNIKQGASINDTYFALSNIVTELVQKNIVPIIIGGGHDLSYSQYLGYEKLNQTVDLVVVDSKFDITNNEDGIDSQSFLNNIIMHQPNYLFNISILGYQTYYVDQPSIETLEKLFFDVHRLGKVRANLEEVEPLVRTADMVSFDISAIKQSDAPAYPHPNPNGFSGDEACRIARYAGMSDKLTSIGFYEINPEYDRSNQTAMLASQMIWYFIDGFYNRKNDLPIKEKKEFVKYTASIKDHAHQMVFYKSKKSSRWWMD